jgi:tyrosine-protein phosphatase YwqE
VRFEDATHYTEKFLYKVLSRDIVPTAIHELRVWSFLSY